MMITQCQSTETTDKLSPSPIDWEIECYEFKMFKIRVFKMPPNFKNKIRCDVLCRVIGKILWVTKRQNYTARDINQLDKGQRLAARFVNKKLSYRRETARQLANWSCNA